MIGPIYLDHNATTPIDRRVFEAMRPYLTELFGNPSSNHPYGWDAHQAVSTAREKVASLLGCAPEEIVFTSGGTESNNLAICGVADARGLLGRIITSEVEHPAVNAPCDRLEKKGCRISRIGVDSSGVVHLGALKSEIDDSVALVTVMHANNETGSLQPIRAIADIAHDLKIPVHTDAAQSVGKVETRVDDLGVDLLSVAGHKLYAPKGVGALYVRNGTKINPVLLGAGHEKGLRPGTENVASIVGLGEACEIALHTLAGEIKRVRGLADELWLRLSQAIPGLKLNGHPADRLPNTLNVSFPGVRSSLLLPRVDQIAASSGAACHEGGDETPSYVLLAMGMPTEQALGAIRLSLGRSTTLEDIKTAASALIKAYEESRRT
jgi:cysteine desulfurase